MELHAPRWLITAILLNGAVLALLAATMFGLVDFEEPVVQVSLGICIFLLYAGVASRLARHPSPRTFGLAAGLWMPGIAVAGGWLAMLGLGLGMGSGGSGASGRLQVGAALTLLLVQVRLARAAHVCATEQGVTPWSLRGALEMRAMVPLVIAGALGLTFGFDLLLAVLTQWREGRVRRAVYEVQACAARFAAAYPERGYPTSLAAMGPEGTGCLDRRLAAGRRLGVVMSYTVERDRPGHVAYFLARATLREPGGYLGTESTAGDTTGLVGSSPPLSSPDHYRPDLVLRAISSLRGCLEQHLVEYPGEPLTESIVELERRMAGDIHLADARSGCRLEAGRRLEKETDEDRAKRLFGTEDGYRLSYRVDGDDAYEIEARPVEYARTALRSYVLRRGGDAHYTVLDRPANEGDPAVPRCLLDDSDVPRPVGCLFLVGTPPVVAFVKHVVPNGDGGTTILLAARDAEYRESPPDASLRFWLDCDPPPYWGPVHQFGRETEARCDVPATGSEARRRVRLWTRDRSGAVSVVEDTLDVRGVQ